MGTLKDLRLPRLGETMERGRVIGWSIGPGSDYRRGDVLLEVETDKTIVEVPALEDGRLIEILAEADSEVEVDAPLARVEVAGAAAVPATGLASATSGEGIGATASRREDALAGGDANGRRAADAAPISPRARRRARDLGVDLAALDGSGRRGRIVERDVLRAAGPDAIGPRAAAATLGADDARERARGGAGRGGVNVAVDEGSVPTRSGALHRRRWLPESGARDSAPEGAGEGVGVTLLHGLFGDVDVWAECALRLARGGRRVDAYDLPGHGRSEVSADTLEACLAPLAERLGTEPPGVLVGHSLGGLLAARLAAALPERVTALVLIAPVGLGRTLDQTFLDALAPPATLAVLRREIGRLSARGLLPGEAHLSAQLARLRESAGALRELAGAIARGGVQSENIGADLEALAVPTRLVWGRRDPILDWRDALAAPPRCALHLLPEAGHMPMWEAGELVATLIEACAAEGGRR